MESILSKNLGEMHQIDSKNRVMDDAGIVKNAMSLVIHKSLAKIDSL
jgi:hypothetical protein